MTKVERLHTEGKKYYSYPYRLYVLEEALRHIKKECPDFAGKDILMVYTANEILEYGKIAECLSNALAKVAQGA